LSKNIAAYTQMNLFELAIPVDDYPCLNQRFDHNKVNLNFSKLKFAYRERTTLWITQRLVVGSTERYLISFLLVQLCYFTARQIFQRCLCL